LSMIFDRLKTVYGYYTNKHILGTYPKLIGVELTNHCDLECVMCPQPDQTRNLGLMEVNLFQKIVDEVKNHSEFMYLHGLGESLLHPKFFEMADYANQAGLKTHLSTNLSFLNEERNEKLATSGIDFIVLSLDGSTKETYESIRVGGDFEKSLKHAKHLLKLKIKYNSKFLVDVQFIQMKKNQNEAGQLKALFSEDELEVIDRFRVKPAFETTNNILKHPMHHSVPCYYLWSTMTILQDGKVSMCCMDFDGKVIVGDLTKERVYDIWNNSAMVKLRDKHKKLDYDSSPICEKCSVPNMGYFSNTTILASAVLSSGTMRRGLSLYESLFVENQWDNQQSKKN
jgi:radical SAM protein with 4Fe4S-binding SPASM domain